MRQSEVEKHTVATDLWLVIDKKARRFSRLVFFPRPVRSFALDLARLTRAARHQAQVYNVTPFFEEHPGGGEVMLQSAGRDGTDDFNVRAGPLCSCTHVDSHHYCSVSGVRRGAWES